VAHGKVKRKICVISGSRSDYGILFSVLNAIEKEPSLKLCLIATCMHLMKEFGYTLRAIEKDGFKVDRTIDISYKEDSGAAMAEAIGKAVSQFSVAYKDFKPDVVLILGDRGEVLAAAVAASYMNIPVAHIHGGEVSGHVDGAVRHAITKLAHIHFTATAQAKQRVLALGEEPWRVFQSGAPALDRLRSGDITARSVLMKKYRIDVKKPLAMVVQHPVQTEMDQADSQILETMNAVTTLKIPAIMIYPNADAGSRRMIKLIKQFEAEGLIQFFKSIPHEDYLGLLGLASVLVGNSSSGIVESPAFKLPVVNIGPRQKGRERSENVLDVPYKKDAIIKAVRKAVNNKNFRQKVQRCHNAYGDGRAAERIVRVLAVVKLDKKLLNKQMTY